VTDRTSDTFPCFAINMFSCLINGFLRNASKSDTRCVERAIPVGGGLSVASLSVIRALAFGAVMPRDRTGDLVNSGERTLGEVIVEYAPLLLDSFPVRPSSPEQILEAHRLNNDIRDPRAHGLWRVAETPRPSAPFIRRSLSRG
jgi:hypothetical protein